VNPKLKYVLANLLLAASYVATGTLGFTLRAIGGATTLLWAPSAIGLAVILLYGLRWIPGFALGACLLFAIRSVPVNPSAFIVVVEVGEIGLGYLLLTRMLRFRPELDRVRDVITFVEVAFAISLLGSTAVACWLFAIDMVPAPRVTTMWGIWWWAHFSGYLIVAPAIFTFARRTRSPHGRCSRMQLEAVALTVTGAIVVLLVLAHWLPIWLPVGNAPYYLLPLMLWAGVRFGPRGAALASFGSSAIAIIAQSFGLGAFSRLFDLQTFVAISTISTLMLSALAVERVRAVELKGAIQWAALDAIITIDQQGRVVELNPAAERMFGIRETDALGADLADLIIPPRLRDAYHRELAHYIQQGARTPGSRYRSSAWHAADDTEFPVEIAITRVPVEDQVLITGFIRDVSAEQQAETVMRNAQVELEHKVEERTAELRAANLVLERREALLREAEELAQLGSFEFEIATKAVKWSDELFEIFGRDVKTFKPDYWNFLEAVHPDDRALLQSHIECAARDGKPFGFEERVVRPDGSVRVLQTQVRVFVDAAGVPLRLAGCSQDITERKQSDAVRSRLVQLVESSEDAMIVLSPAGTIETWNAAASKLFGYGTAETIGKSSAELLPDRLRPVFERMLEAVRNGKRIPPYELQHMRKDGSTFEAAVTTSAVLEHGQVVGISNVLRDVTNEKRVERQIRESLNEKEVLLREIHHRVKNNLQVISSLLNIQVSSEPDDVARKSLVESQNRIQSMALVHQLLYQSKDFAKIDASEYLTQLTMRLVETYNIAPERISVRVVSSPLALDIDRAIPCGLIVNELVTNAFAHAFPNHRSGHVLVALQENHEHVTLIVADDGVGMSPNVDIEHAHTFGLRIAHTLALQLGGTISLSRANGTEIRVVFPIVERQLTHAA